MHVQPSPAALGSAPTPANVHSGVFGAFDVSYHPSPARSQTSISVAGMWGCGGELLGVILHRPCSFPADGISLTIAILIHQEEDPVHHLLRREQLALLLGVLLHPAGFLQLVNCLPERKS